MTSSSAWRRDGRSISALLRVTREQLEDRPTVEYVFPVVVVAFLIPALAVLILEVQHLPKLLARAYEGIAVDLILVAIYSFKSIWIDRGRRAEKEMISEWSKVAVKEALSKPGIVLRPLRKDEFKLLQAMARKDLGFKSLVRPLLSLGIKPKQPMPDL